MIIQQHLYDMEKDANGYRRSKRPSTRRVRPKSKSNLNIIQHINHGKKEVSL